MNTIHTFYFSSIAGKTAMNIQLVYLMTNELILDMFLGKILLKNTMLM